MQFSKLSIIYPRRKSLAKGKNIAHKLLAIVIMDSLPLSSVPSIADNLVSTPDSPDESLSDTDHLAPPSAPSEGLDKDLENHAEALSDPGR